MRINTLLERFIKWIIVIAWWVWLVFVVLTAVIGYSWYSYETSLEQPNFEPATTIIGTVVVLLGELTALALSWQHRNDTKVILNYVTTDGEKTRQLIQEQSSQNINQTNLEGNILSNADFERISFLWSLINFEKVEKLLKGFSNNHVYRESLTEIRFYLHYRGNPKYILDDREIEIALDLLDQDLSEVIELCGRIFYPAGDSTFKWSHVHVDKEPHIYAQHRQIFEHFIEENVNPTWVSYLKLIELLKKRNVYNRLEFPDNSDR